MQSLHHIAISASAGSGKTYALTNRFIYLLHLTEQPERIVALTFTRTAAGEFFHKIIERLCDAATDPAKAARLSRELSIQADCDRYHALLGLLVRSMHRLNLQTLDSFFYRVVSAFSLELGLSGSLRLLDETAEPRVRNEVRDRIVHRPGELGAELNEFWHAFKQATYGQEQRSVERIVSDFIDGLFALYLEAPDAALWGRPDTIWPGGCPWQADASPDWDQLADALLAALPDDLGKSQRTDFETAAAKVRVYPVEEKLNALLTRALNQAADILAGRGSLQCGRGKNNQIVPDDRLRTALADCLKAVVWHHLHRALQNTQGVHRILQAYNESYDQLVRRPGRLAFADLTHLLSPAGPGSPLQRVDPESRQLMDFRLDGQYDHWLFDEFQDTSRPQWQVVANLIDEVVQDPAGRRSFFYVGDTKQCLYLWRNSDDRLFHDILTRYRGRIHSQTLATSWRSAPPVLDAVNAVFDDPAAIEECFNPDVARRWQRAWQHHTASEATEKRSGYACWLRADEAEGPGRNERLLEILQTLDPIERGLSVGILVRKNDDANEIADFLRSHSRIPVHTGSAVRPATDNAAGVALLAMVRLAAHPGDDMARGTLRLIDHSTPGDSLAEAVPRLRTRLLEDGAERAVRWAAHRVAAHLPDDDRRHRERLDRLIEAARRFDAEERRDLDGLHRFLHDSTGGECDAGDAVIIETIHKSKGLEYDIVLLVEEEKTSSLTIDRSISPYRNADGDAEWILEPLKKDIMQADPQLGRLLAQGESQGGFEALCRLYVAMTRAKRALYIVTDPSRAQRGSLVRFLGERLGTEADERGVFWETGDPQWFHERPVRPAAAPAPSASPPADNFPPSHPRLKLARPSEGTSTTIKAGWLFDLGERSASFGTEVHDAFEQIEWLGPETLLPETLGETARKCIQTSLDQADIRAVFTQPEQACTVWRERAFSYVEDERFVNGVFDRVHLHTGHDGKPARAEIIDFKTDRIHDGNTLEQAAEHHRPQLEAYRSALAKILGLDESRIDLLLIFTDAPALVTL
ncbi:MAG: UvrD-helicase domain-containing protein [Verrucomicrobiota bacterium]